MVKKEFSFKEIEEKWQKKWESEGVFEVKENPNKKKCYVLEMFPYPSGEGIHIGHAFNYVIVDVYARFKTMQGFNVLHPAGYDSLGLPAENAAIKSKKHPEEYTKNSIKNFMKQQKRLGISYDWSRVINTAEPSYYKWDQWIFLKMFEKGLVYQKEAPVNWCDKCQTIISNEQAQGGKCERCESPIEIRIMKQWFIKIIDYADRLLEGHKKLNWPEKTIAMQKNWIGKSYGTSIDFEINKEKWQIFTTRPDTIFGVTFMVVSAQHPRLMELVTKERKKDVEKFLKKLKSVSEKELVDMEKEGVFTGSYAVNPSNGEKVPVYAGNFVVADYGSGMVMAVPAHDQRDFEFAKKYEIEIKQVITPDLKCYEHDKKLLKELDKIKKEADKKKLDFWIIGGLANAFHVGMVYRAHRDLDLITKDKKNCEDFCKVLEGLGYKKIKEKKLIGGLSVKIYQNENGLFVDIAPYTGDFDLRKSDLEKNEKEFEGVKSKIVSKRFCETYKKYWLTKRKESKDKLDLDYLAGRAYTDSGILINSKQFNGIPNEEAKGKITKWLNEKELARKEVNYRFRDWSVARQRYWGTPIPLIHCDKCGVVPVSEKDLPVELPKEVKFSKGNPLLTNKKWLNVKCPKCGKSAKREVNTMDTFVNSSWYFLRFCDPENDEEIFDKKKVGYWMPIDLYIGGAEHTCMHLIYCRFYTMFLYDLGLINFDEPALRLFHQGMINDEKGEKMSKSKGNVVEPIETMEKYGVDTTRFFILSEASPEKGFNWDDRGIQGSFRIINKIINIIEQAKFGKDSKEIRIKINKSIKEITEQIEKIEYRKSTIELRELFEIISKQKKISKGTLEKSLKLLSPFCPHIAEELWEKLGNKKFISLEKWPKAEELNLEKKEENLNDKISLYVKEVLKKVEERGTKVKKVYIYIMPFEISKINKEKISDSLGKDVIIYSVKDADKYDPENRAKKARPGKPGIFLE